VPLNKSDNLNIEPAIQIRKNASTKAKGCPLRRDEVLLIGELGYERWKQLKDAGIVFSSIKRVLGEDLLSKKFKAQKVEAGLTKIWSTSKVRFKPTILFKYKNSERF